MYDIRIYNDRNNSWKVLIISITFLVVVSLFYRLEEWDIILKIFFFFCLIFIGLGIFICLSELLRWRPILVINDKGIIYQHFKKHKIRWEQINFVSPLEYNDMLFLSFQTDDTYQPYSKFNCLNKLNQSFGFGKFNIGLNNLNIETSDLLELINLMVDSDPEERKKIIQKYKLRPKTKEGFVIKALITLLFSVILVSISITYSYWFIAIMIIGGIFAIMLRWGIKNKKLKTIAQYIAWTSMLHLLLLYFMFRYHENMTNEVGNLLYTEIENHQIETDTLPPDISPLIENLNLNFIEKRFARKIEYNIYEDDFELRANFLFNKRRYFNSYKAEWSSIKYSLFNVQFNSEK